jgi:dipeptide/tripeptide permease
VKWLARVGLMGAALAAAVVVTGALWRGPEAALAGLLGAAVALAAQAGAVALLRPAMGDRTPEFVSRWALGMAVRGASFLVVALLLIVLKDRLPVFWIAAGYLVVLMPLLFVETRFLK